MQEDQLQELDNISKLIIIFWNDIKILLINRELLINTYSDIYELKELNFITNEQEKKYYIEFILLTLYTELDYFLYNRFRYREFEDNKIKNEQELEKVRKYLEYIYKVIPDYELTIRQERSKDEPLSFYKNIESINKEIIEYQERTQAIIDSLPLYYKNPTHKAFIDFYSRENKDNINIIKNLILRYLHLVTQICFGESKHYSLFFKILKILTKDYGNSYQRHFGVLCKENSCTDEKYCKCDRTLWGEYTYKNVLDIDNNSGKLKICFQGLIDKTLLLEKDKESFDKLKSFNHFDSQLVARYEAFIFENMFFDKYSKFKKEIHI
ncbi:MAG: hypothetical protein ACRCVW_02150 [Brevinema sp.]